MNGCLKEKKGSSSELPFRDRAGIRTQDPQLRRLLLYPAELLDHPFKNVVQSFGGNIAEIFGRSACVGWKRSRLQAL